MSSDEGRHWDLPLNMDPNLEIWSISDSYSANGQIPVRGFWLVRCWSRKKQDIDRVVFLCGSLVCGGWERGLGRCLVL